MKIKFLTLLFFLTCLTPFVGVAENPFTDEFAEFRSKELQLTFYYEDFEVSWLSLQNENPFSIDRYAPIIRVGSPIFNAIRNHIRNKKDAGKWISGYEEIILKIEEIEGVHPNDLLIFTVRLFDKNNRQIPYNGKANRGSDWTIKEKWVILEAHSGELQQSQVEAFIFGQMRGVAEIFVENGLVYAVGVPVTYSLLIPFLEIKNALDSNSVTLRFKNSGLAIWDGIKGTLYSLLDVPVQMYEVDPMGTLKSGGRALLTPIQLGGTIITKAIRLPFDILKGLYCGAQNLMACKVPNEHNFALGSYKIDNSVKLEENLSVDAEGIGFNINF